MIGIGLIFTNNTVFSDAAIEKRVVAQLDYDVQLVEEGISVNLFIRPEWIPQKGEERTIGDVVATLDGNDIVLGSVYYREHDIWFQFITKNQMNRNRGVMLTNHTLEPSGTLNAGQFMSDFHVKDSAGQELITGNLGVGPGFEFSFGVDLEEEARMKDGIYLTYTGYKSYTYTRK